ncbi:MAG: hypothetical protein QGF00_13365 [Planctomycetota bacterium]|jgi:hypothetical protein|nr:hypothetical protein [Planctomycetota bacterium]MDP7250587.1 hypothetical protein [Planctomycetota bacterium]
MPVTHRRAAIAIALATLASTARAESRATLAGRDYPRAFFFRAAEGGGPAIQRGRFTYEQWHRTFSRLSGIMGKSLEEEVPGRSANIPIFTRFKKQHPDKVVLLHYNGNSRDPRDGIGGFFAGHWVYYVGCKITKDLPAQTGECEVHVEDPSRFRVKMGRYIDKNVDIGICMLDENGKPNWHVAEQVQLLSKDNKGKVLKIRRGAFGTKPLQFPAGRAYIAPHATEGPWGKRSNLLWFYNYSTRCPRDAEGRNCVDVLVDDFGDRFLPGGALAAFDGVEFDVLHWEHGGPRSGNRGLDMDADGEADAGHFDGVNTYSVGVFEFCRQLRQKLGEDRVIQADGGTVRGQRAFGQLNGIESEGWPWLADWEISDWSGGMNRHRFWAAFAREPRFSYINHKYTMAGDTPGSRKRPDVPFSRHRLVLAVAQCFDAAVCYSTPPRREGKNELIGVWDELWQGTDEKLGWLGQPTGQAVCLAKQQPDLLRGQGKTMPPAFLSKWSGDGALFERDDNGLRVSFGESDREARKFLLAGVPAVGRDLFVTMRMRAASLKGYPSAVPRLTWVGIAADQGMLVRSELPEERGVRIRGKEEMPDDRTTGGGVRYFQRRMIDGEGHPAYLCHPPYKSGVGYTYWERTVTVPDQGKLAFYTGLSKKAETRSDGVTFRVLLKPADGEVATIFDRHIREWRWRSHSVSLSQWAGKRASLKFITDCGPKNNSTTDHSSWGDVRVLSGRPGVKTTEPKRYMTFAGAEWFESTFYFREVRTPSVDLEFSIEGSGDLWIADMSVHAHPEAMFRRFDNGLVLVNPAHHDYTFDLAEIAPGKRFRRIKAHPMQDTQVNNGQPVGEKVSVGERDGLFLVADE